MDNLDVNVLVQVFNEKISSLMTELVVKEATIRQLNNEMQKLLDTIRAPKTAKKQEDTKQSDDFQ